MENASKALFIAGAVLIAILLIGVGMMVFGGAQGGIDEAILQMDATQKKMFNNSFDQYEGTRRRGADVRALIGNIITSNNANQDIDGKIVSILGDTEISASKENLNADTMATYRASINTGATYTVTVQIEPKTGLITTVTITKNS